MKEQDILSEYLPENSVSQVMEWIVENNIHLKITKSRKTKLGDYRPPVVHPHHRISINHDLNPFSFLITFVHELAHLLVWEKHRNKIAPHGIEWKNEYRRLMQLVLNENIFPEDIYNVLKQSIINSKASSTSDLQLLRVLKKYDGQSTESHLEDLSENTTFQIENGKKFIKGKKRRTRYLCLNIFNNRQYLFHPLTPVQKVDDVEL